MSAAKELRVTLPGGRRVDVEVGDHVIHTDQPLGNGGDDTAPTPYDLFLASVGACAGIFVQGFCAARRIPFHDIRIVERAYYDDRGALREIALELALPEEFPSQYCDALVRSVEQCSVKRAIAAQPEIVTTAVFHHAHHTPSAPGP